MTDKLTPPLMASDMGSAANTETEGLAEKQYHSIPTISLEHHDHESDDEETSDNVTMNNDRDATTRIDGGQGVKPESQNCTYQHESTIEKLTLERDKLGRDANLSRRQLETICRDSEALKCQVRDLRLQLSEGNSHIKQQVTTLTAEKRALESELAEAYQRGQKDGLRTQLAQSERVILIQQVEAYKNEADKWKQEALGKGSDVLNKCWQASVDEAVRRKREQDSMAIKALQEELAALKAEKRK